MVFGPALKDEASKPFNRVFALRGVESLRTKTKELMSQDLLNRIAFQAKSPL